MTGFRFLSETIGKPARPAYVYSRTVPPGYSDQMRAAEPVEFPENVADAFSRGGKLHTVLTCPETGEILETYDSL